MVLDSQKNHKDGAESFHIPHISFPITNILYYYGTFVTINEPIDTLLLTPVHTVFIVLIFYPVFFFCPGHHITFSSRVFLGSSWL